MKLILVSLVFYIVNVVQAQNPKELEFNTLPCNSVGDIGSDGKTCTKEDVQKHERATDKILTDEEKKIEKLSQKRDPLKIQRANKKRSQGTWVRSGTSN